MYRPNSLWRRSSITHKQRQEHEENPPKLKMQWLVLLRANAAGEFLVLMPRNPFSSCQKRSPPLWRCSTNPPRNAHNLTVSNIQGKGVFGRVRTTAVYRRYLLGILRHELDTGTRHFGNFGTVSVIPVLRHLGKFGTTSVPVPDTLCKFGALTKNTPGSGMYTLLSILTLGNILLREFRVPSDG